jgi:serine/threonine-protein kinase SRPK3
VDMGNGCWTHHHFTSQIQTRQYRSPETIIGVPYGPSADIWSLACMVFELLTGDFLFEPRKGYYYDKDDDHLAQMIELLGPMPKNFALSGKNSKRFFDSTGHLRRIRGLNYWPLHRVLTEKYRFLPKEAESLADFLQCMLMWYPEKRATAQEMLDHPWLKMARNDNYRLSDEAYEKMMEEIKEREELEKRKRELEIILREGNMDPEILSKRIRSENMSELAESNFEK